MPIAKYSKINNTNEVTRRLSQGRGNIKGIKLCASVDDVALIPVEVLGVSFAGGNRTGVMIHVAPIGGHGRLTMDPQSLIDDTEKARDLFRRKSECSEAYQEYRSVRNDRERRARLLDLREKLSPKDKATFDAMAEDQFGKGVDMVKAIGKASGEYQLNQLYQKCVKLSFKIDDETDYTDY